MGAIMTRFRISAVLTGAAMLFSLSGCTISTHEKEGKSGSDNVDIRTPVGSLSVRSGEVQARDTGLSVYPGARLTPGHRNNDKESANVNIDTSFFGVKVVAVHFQSDDPQEKILDFYRKDLGKFGNVVQCDSNSSRGFGKHDGDGPVTCEEDSSGIRGATLELKAGTRHNQHIVAVEKHGNSSEFTLVYVRLHGGDKDTI